MNKVRLVFSCEGVLLCLIFFLLPFYAEVHKGGGFQIVDISIMIAVIFVVYTQDFFLFFQRLNLFRPSILLFLFFILYQGTNLFLHFIFLPSYGMWSSYLCPWYGAVITIMIYSICSRIRIQYGEDMLRRFLTNSLLISLIIPIVKLFTFKVGFGHYLSFARPNQIVFFVLMQFVVIFYVILSANDNWKLVDKIKIFVLLHLNLLFLYVSYSRSAFSLVVFYLVLLFLLVRKKKDFKYFKYNGVIFLIAALGFVLFYLMNKHIASSVLTWKKMSLPDLYSDFIFRATNDIGFVISNDIKGLFWGFGIKLNASGLEYHNNFIEILSQSGVFGLLLYLSLVVTIFYDLVRRKILYSLPFFIFIIVSMFHFTQRSRFTWVFLAFIFLILAFDDRKHKTVTGSK